jgi:hypothetical protein
MQSFSESSGKNTEFYSSWPLDPIPKYLNVIHVLVKYFLKINFNSISKWLLYHLTLHKHYITFLVHITSPSPIFKLSWFNQPSHVLYIICVMQLPLQRLILLPVTSSSLTL